MTAREIGEVCRVALHLLHPATMEPEPIHLGENLLVFLWVERTTELGVRCNLWGRVILGHERDVNLGREFLGDELQALFAVLDLAREDEVADD